MPLLFRQENVSSNRFTEMVHEGSYGHERNDESPMLVTVMIAKEHPSQPIDVGHRRDHRHSEHFETIVPIL